MYEYHVEYNELTKFEPELNQDLQNTNFTCATYTDRTIA